MLKNHWQKNLVLPLIREGESLSERLLTERKQLLHILLWEEARTAVTVFL